jgi:glycerophosphoryl diester phosphodiesterase
MVYGGDLPMEVIKQRLPDVKVMSRASLKGCALRYIGLGWTGYVPQECRNTLLLVPVNLAPYVWGWPVRFLDRMHAVGTEIFVTGPYAKGDPGTSGIDAVEQLSEFPEGYAVGIWTNRIDRIGPKVRSRPN